MSFFKKVFFVFVSLSVAGFCMCLPFFPFILNVSLSFFYSCHQNFTHENYRYMNITYFTFQPKQYSNYQPTEITLSHFNKRAVLRNVAFNTCFQNGKDVITIASLNVPGLGNDTKRRETFNWLRSKHFSIYLLQEIHCSEKTKDLWANEWGYKCLFSTRSSTKVGIGILFNNNFELQIMKNYIDPARRYIICDLMANRKLVTLVF